ncbi:hypothetical protein PIB30_050288 [Stylosanthes scabra]|uniref:Uncharacterized protein n=1 Tax=Stylosanthes scabra TaxID=79078 RepID=A0ABU6WG30_9FABA|nr:hypothetical protein [Stylosanthes scabra]
MGKKKRSKSRTNPPLSVASNLSLSHSQNLPQSSYPPLTLPLSENSCRAQLVVVVASPLSHRLALLPSPLCCRRVACHPWVSALNPRLASPRSPPSVVDAELPLEPRS